MVVRRRSAPAQPFQTTWIDHHFVVDPDKFDYYAMDCYRLIGDNNLAEMHAREIIRKSTNPDGTANAPMRIAESQLTLGVVAARRGDLERAVSLGREALSTDRKSQPSLLMVGSELDTVLRETYGNEPATIEFHEQLTSSASGRRSA